MRCFAPTCNVTSYRKGEKMRRSSGDANCGASAAVQLADAPHHGRHRLNLLNSTETLALLLYLLPTGRLLAEDWPSFRGPQGTGVSIEKALPETWGATKNITWRVPLPDRGNSTPIVWHDRVFLTQATDDGASRGLMCFARTDGKLLWKAHVKFDGEESTNSQNPYCSSSPATDGTEIFESTGVVGQVPLMASR